MITDAFRILALVLYAVDAAVIVTVVVRWAKWVPHDKRRLLAIHVAAVGVFSFLALLAFAVATIDKFGQALDWYITPFGFAAALVLAVAMRSMLVWLALGREEPVPKLKGSGRLTRALDFDLQKAALWMLQPARRVYVGVLFAFSCALVVVTILAFSTLKDRIVSDELQQIGNRARNVGTWCPAITAQSNVMTAFAARALPGVAPPHFVYLPCKELVEKTLMSGRPR